MLLEQAHHLRNFRVDGSLVIFQRAELGHQSWIHRCNNGALNYLCTGPLPTKSAPSKIKTCHFDKTMHPLLLAKKTRHLHLACCLLGSLMVPGNAAGTHSSMQRHDMQCTTLGSFHKLSCMDISFQKLQSKLPKLPCKLPRAGLYPGKTKTLTLSYIHKPDHPKPFHATKRTYTTSFHKLFYDELARASLGKSTPVARETNSAGSSSMAKKQETTKMKR